MEMVVVGYEMTDDDIRPWLPPAAFSAESGFQPAWDWMLNDMADPAFIDKYRGLMKIHDWPAVFDHIDAAGVPPAATYLCKGIANLCMDEYAGAVAYFDRILEKESELIPAHILKGGALERLGRYDEAMACFDRALDIDSGNSICHYLKGSLLMKAKEYERALDCFDMALDADPESKDALAGKGTALGHLGSIHDEDVHERLDDVLKLHRKAREVVYATQAMLLGDREYGGSPVDMPRYDSWN